MKVYSLNPRYNPRLSYFVILIVAIAVTAAFTSDLTAQSLQQSTSIDIENFGKVNDNYYRGSQPKGREFDDLKNFGIKTIVDLRKDRLDEAEAWAHAAGLQYIHIPLTTKRAATEEQTKEFLSIVNDDANWPVFVHCKGGRHRTGEMTAIYRITHDGWTADEAYKEMKKYDFEDSWFYPRSLKKYVFAFYERFAAQTSQAYEQRV